MLTEFCIYCEINSLSGFEEMFITLKDRQVAYAELVFSESFACRNLKFIQDKFEDIKEIARKYDYSFVSISERKRLEKVRFVLMEKTAP